MSVLTPPKCPQCSAELKLGANGELDFWSCPSGHGLGFTVTEAYTRLEEDEISRLWGLAGSATAGKYHCPMCSAAMAAVTVGYDEDEAKEGEPGDQPDVGTVGLDVCVVDEFVWFEPGELDVLPADRPDAKPSADEDARLEQVRKTFDENYDAALRSHDSLTDRLYARVAKHGGFLRFLGGVSKPLG